MSNHTYDWKYWEVLNEVDAGSSETACGALNKTAAIALDCARRYRTCTCAPAPWCVAPCHTHTTPMPHHAKPATAEGDARQKLGATPPLCRQLATANAGYSDL